MNMAIHPAPATMMVHFLTLPACGRMISAIFNQASLARDHQNHLGRQNDET
jgi:hypothetical protein